MFFHPSSSDKTMSNLKTIILAAFLVGVVSIGVLLGTTNEEKQENNVGATGGSFALLHEFMQADQDVATTTETFIATTTPRFLAGGATTTVIVSTYGISDLRLNLNANASATVALLPTMAIAQEVVGASTTDDAWTELYTVSSVSAGDVITDKFITWQLASTTDSGTTQTDVVPHTSIHLTNLNAPKIRFSIGSDIGVDFSLEFVKVTPR